MFALAYDPVSYGIVPDLVKPGNNITGVKLPDSDVIRLRFLKEIAPEVTTIYLPYNPHHNNPVIVENIIAAAKKLNLTIYMKNFENESDIKATMMGLPHNIKAVFLMHDHRIESFIQDINEVAVKRGWVVTGAHSTLVERGALFSYGYNEQQVGKQAAQLAKQIISGMNHDIPVEAAVPYFEINMKTANAIGIAIPHYVLRQSDRIIY